MSFSQLKTIGFFFIILLMETSCQSLSKGWKDKDESFTMVQQLELEGYDVYVREVAYNRIELVYTYTRNNRDPEITLELNQKSSFKSTIAILVDGEEFELRPGENKNYIIPPNLWLSLASCMFLDYSLLTERGRVNYSVEGKNLRKLKAFLQTAILKRREIIPVVPEGKAKW